MDGDVSMASTDNDALLREARERFELAMSAELDNRAEAIEDLQFLAPTEKYGQWPEEVRQAREAAGRPMLQINMLPKFVAQVANDMRINQTAIKVSPVDDGADEELAEVISGLIRNIERVSDAPRIYAEAGGQAAACGMGHWQVTTEYTSDDVFDQDIRIRPIPNPFAVLWDPNAVEYDRSDAEYCFVYQDMGLDAFKKKYPKAAVTSWDDYEAATNFSQALSTKRDWFLGDTIRVAKYYRIETKREKLYRLTNGQVVCEDDIEADETGALLELMSDDPADMREVDRPLVRIYIMSGAEVLEGPYDWPGSMIPVISTWGRETHIGERVVRTSVIRYAKDPQRQYNYWRTAEIEAIALQPKAPWLVTDKHIEGYEGMWQRANLDNQPYLVYNPDPQAGGMPQRQQPAQPSAAMLQEVRYASEDLNATTGIYPASLGARSNETSGKAILARQREGDVGTYDYIDNLHRSIAKTGRILLDLLPKVYDSTRMIRILGEDEAKHFIQVNAPNPAYSRGEDDREYVTVLRDEKGHVSILPDLSAGKYDISVSTGPSFSTRREEARESMMEFIRVLPQAGAVAADLIVKAQDWPGADEIAKRMRKIGIQQGLIQPSEEDGDELPPPPQPDPKAQADAEKAAADAEYKRAQTQGVALDNAAKELALGQQIGQMMAVLQSVQATLQAMMPAPGMPPPNIGQAMPMAPQGVLPPAPVPGSGLSFDQPSPGYADDGVAPETFPS